MLRLGFHYHTPAYLDEQKRLMMPGYLGRFVDSLAERCETVTCFLHSARPDEAAFIDYPIRSANVRWVNIGPHASVPARTLHASRHTQPLRDWRADLDALLIRGPSPLLPAMAKAASPLPVALLLVGDYLAGVNDLPQPRWRKEAIRLWTHWNTRQQLKIARRSLTFVNSHLLYEQLRPVVPNLVETRTTTLNMSDFHYRADTCQSAPVRLLYTGRMDRAKGLFEIVEAVEMLTSAGLDVVLDLVGWPAKGDTIIEELLNDARQRGVSERVFYHGFKAVGPDLFAYYKQADIYVIASKSSEGFPRTIWEALAHSLPVVATRVGSINEYLDHGKSAWLIDEASGMAIAEGVRSVIDDASLRHSIIQNGFALARQNTLEYRTRELITSLTDWLARS